MSPRPLSQIRLDQDKTWFQWLYPVFNASEEEIYHACGEDAIFYLKFEKKAIFISVFQFLFAMVVVLPINLTGGKDKKGFEKTSFNNVQLEKNQTILVPRIILTIVNFILVCTIGFLFYKNLKKLRSNIQPELS
jgi:hypothetical protein